jgi:hypothetical protein
MLALAAYLILLGGLGLLVVASLGTIREAFRQRARLRGYLVAIGLAVASLLGIWALLI